MFRENPAEFGRQLTLAVKILAVLRDVPMSRVQQDLALAIGRAEGTIEHWRKGHIPQDGTDIQGLGKAIIEQRRAIRFIDLDKDWLQTFFKAAGYPTLESVMEMLGE